MKACALLLSVFALAACSHKAPEPQAPSGKADAASVTTPWDGMKKDEQRAKDVQKTIDQQAAEQRKQLEAAEQ